MTYCNKQADEIKFLKEKIDALKDTYYEAGIGCNEIKDLLILIRGEEFVKSHFSEFNDE